MCFTYIYTKICFNFQKLVHCCTLCCYGCPCDICVPTCGPHCCSLPVKIKKASIDNKRCTNKIKLMFNCFWNSEVEGMLMNDVKIKGGVLKIQYAKKEKNEKCKSKKKESKSGADKKNKLPKKCDVVINIPKKTINGEDILFDEVKLA